MAIKNFSWVIPGKLSGSDIPGNHSIGPDSVRCDLEMLRSNGVLYLVSLEKPVGPIEVICSELGMEWNYFPISDFGIPEDSAKFLNLVTDIISAFESGRPVCIHCHAGIGRTGMVLTCIMGCYFSISSVSAVKAVRKVRNAIDTDEQECFVKDFLSKYEH